MLYSRWIEGAWSDRSCDLSQNLLVLSLLMNYCPALPGKVWKCCPERHYLTRTLQDPGSFLLLLSLSWAWLAWELCKSGTALPFFTSKPQVQGWESRSVEKPTVVSSGLQSRDWDGQDAILSPFHCWGTHRQADFFYPQGRGCLGQKHLHSPLPPRIFLLHQKELQRREWVCGKKFTAILQFNMLNSDRSRLPSYFKTLWEL